MRAGKLKKRILENDPIHKSKMITRMVNMVMKFDDLVSKIDPSILLEKYYKYTFPSKKSLQMYDFYVLDYLKFLVDRLPPNNHRDLPPDLEDSVSDAVKVLFPALRNELLDAVFYAVCAEMRHADRYSSNKHIFNDAENLKKINPERLGLAVFVGGVCPSAAEGQRAGFDFVPG